MTASPTAASAAAGTRGPHVISSWLLLGAAVTAACVGTVTAVTAWRVPGISAASDSPAATALVLAAGAGPMAVGLEHLRRGRRRRVGALLAIVGLLWLVSEWGSPSMASGPAFTVGLSLGWLWPAVLVHALLAFTGAGMTVLGRWVVVLAYAGFGLGLGVVPALTFDRAAMGCAFCPPDVIAIAPSRAVFDVSTLAGSIVGATACLAACLLLLRNLPELGPGGRRLSAPVVVPGALAALVVAIDLGWPATLGAVSPAVAHLLRFAEAALLILLAAGISLEWVRVRRSRILVARIVADLDRSAPVGGLRYALASTLGDAGLRVAYRLPDGTSVDAAGGSLQLEDPPPAGRALTPIVRDAEVVAVLDHRAEFLQSPEMMEDVIRAARLGLEHERLQALARAQLIALTAARKRIVAASSAERRRLEHDLHDGAQQRLVAMTLSLRLLSSDAATADEHQTALIEDAGEQIAQALDELREVAHGLYPSVLADEGLEAAVESIAEGAKHPVRVSIEDVEPLPAPVAEAAYALVAESVRLGSGAVETHVTRAAGCLTIQVRGPELTDYLLLELGDRIGAVDGVLAVNHPAPGRMGLRAEIPCAS